MKPGVAVERVYVVSYDIANDGRRTRLSRFLESHGQRVQWSVFELIATDDSIRELLAAVTASDEMFDAEEDSVRCYPLCANCRQAVDVRGAGRPFARPGSPVVL